MRAPGIPPSEQSAQRWARTRLPDSPALQNRLIKRHRCPSWDLISFSPFELTEQYLSRVVKCLQEALHEREGEKRMTTTKKREKRMKCLGVREKRHLPFDPSWAVNVTGTEARDTLPATAPVKTPRPGARAAPRPCLCHPRVLASVTPTSSPLSPSTLLSTGSLADVFLPEADSPGTRASSSVS